MDFPIARGANLFKELQARSLSIIQWNEYPRLYSIGTADRSHRTKLLQGDGRRTDMKKKENL